MKFGAVFTTLAFVAGMTAAVFPVHATDWSITAHVNWVETTYAPGNLPLAIDKPAGTCPAGGALYWQAQGSTIEEKVANYNAALAALVTAQTSGSTVTVVGVNAGCVVQFLYKNQN